MFEFAMSEFEGDSMVVECDPRRGEHMARCLMYSGDTVPKDVNAVVAAIKANRAIHFASWSLASFKCGIDHQSLAVMPAGDVISNSTSIAEAVSRVGQYKF